MSLCGFPHRSTETPIGLRTGGAATDDRRGNDLDPVAFSFMSDMPTSAADTVCYRHPGRATRLSCTECGNPICVECSHDAPVGQKCPDCAKLPGRYRVVQARASQRSAFDGAPFSAVMLGAIAAIFAVRFFGGDLNAELLQRFSAFNFAISQGEWWRGLTAALLHVDFLHVLFNGYAIYLFGPRLERQVGTPAFAALYVASAAAGSAVSFITGDLGDAGIGASGAVFGLLGAWLFVSWRLRGTAHGRAQFNQLLLLLALNAALPFFLPLIGWQAHLGGLVAGIVIAWGWSTFAAGRPDARVRRLWVALPVFALSMALLFVPI